MKYVLTNRLLIKFFLLAFTLTLINCQKDEQPIKESIIYTNNLYQERYISINEIPNIENSLARIINSQTQNKVSGSSNDAIFDYENILEVIDTLNNINYSFRFRFPNTPISEFYNLIIGKNSVGEITEPFVLKYKCDESYINQYITNGFNFSYFKGEVALHKYTDYFDQGYFNRGGDQNCPPQFDEVGDPIPCETQPIDLAGGGGGSNDSSGGGPSSGGSSSGSNVGSNNCVTIVATVLCTCAGHGFGEGCTCANGPYLTDITVCNSNMTRTSSNSKDSEDCPNCDISTEGGVGVNTVSITTMRSTLKGLGLTDAGISWLSNVNNIENINILYNYLISHSTGISNSFTSEAKEYVKSSIDDVLSPSLLTSNIQLDYEAAILKMTNHLKLFGEVEDEIYAEYIESLIPEFDAMTIGEVRAIYLEVKNTVNQLTINYALSITTPVVTDLIIPIVSYAIFEATAGTAVKLLQKIPVSMVLRGYRLNRMVKKISQLGIQGNQAHVRELHNMTVNKADELFKAITKDAVSLNNPNSYTTVANMGNGNFIMFRTYSGGLSEGTIATIEFNFAQVLGTNSYKLKFYP